jgi:hypothetical protein
VKAATCMAENPSAPLPAHMQTWKETMALYRLHKEDDVMSSRTDAADTRNRHADRLRGDPSCCGYRTPAKWTRAIIPQPGAWERRGNERGRGLYLPAGAGHPARERRGVGLCVVRTRMSRKPAPAVETQGLPQASRVSGKWMCGCAR